VKEDDVYVP
jgi:hypothetical protein